MQRCRGAVAPAAGSQQHKPPLGGWSLWPTAVRLYTTSPVLQRFGLLGGLESLWKDTIWRLSLISCDPDPAERERGCNVASGGSDQIRASSRRLGLGPGPGARPRRGMRCEAGTGSCWRPPAAPPKRRTSRRLCDAPTATPRPARGPRRAPRRRPPPPPRRPGRGAPAAAAPRHDRAVRAEGWRGGHAGRRAGGGGGGGATACRPSSPVAVATYIPPPAAGQVEVFGSCGARRQQEAPAEPPEVARAARPRRPGPPRS
jgi:hypothetical protein